MTFTVIMMILGFMIAILFKTVQEPVVRDTRDIWQLRKDLQKEQELQSKLLAEIHNVEQVLEEYKKKDQDSKVKALKKQLESLKKEVGLSEAKGPGVILTIEPLMTNLLEGNGYNSVPPELLSRLINELNRYDAKAIAVSDQRIISISPIRWVNGRTYVNNTPLPPLPIEIKVLAENAKKLHDHMIVSQSVDDFAIVNLKLTSVIKKEVVLPAYDEPLRIKFMEYVE